MTRAASAYERMPPHRGLVAHWRFTAMSAGRTAASALVFEDAPIRRFTVHRSHTNPDTGQTLLGPHLHTWDDQWGGELAQPPRNITVGDPNDELFDFLREFNTLLRGAYEPLRAERASARGIAW